ncbi:MAG: smalltalk protein [Bacteroidaceae bacterium]|nr:smalltalk protein [Bacteroidaceae bacterium]MBQ3238381.1 smalltalk protein [Bacteroidaceae bacterium]MBQ7967245.1 smalltalk protein [Bacteroidaceae bacterium]MBQ7968051.1 smalltalk protein [Bacteroidaceae bacterium]MBQ8219902.1 smalltalk protein [Bacteroidaceae bacterium]
MKVNWKQVLKIVITVLTALAGALGVASCAV